MKCNLDEMASEYAESATIAERSATMTQSHRSLRDRSVFELLVIVVLVSGCVSAVVLALIGFAGLGSRLIHAPLPSITVSEETTHFTGPLDAEGGIDYGAALNQRFGRPSPMRRNSAVHLLQSIDPEDVPDTVYASVNMDRPPRDGIYIEDIDRGLLHNQALKDRTFLFNETARPWVRDDYPVLAAALDAHFDVLEQLHVASKCDYYFLPYSSPNGLHENGALALGLMSGRDSLCARAMLRLGEGDAAGAWADLLALRRLARLLGQSTRATDIIVSFRVEGLSHRGILALLQTLSANPALLDRMQADLNLLPSIWRTSTLLDNHIRCETLQVMLLARKQNEYPWSTESLQSDQFDWNVALKATNQLFDQLVSIASIPAYKNRTKAWQQFSTHMQSQELSSIDSFAPAPGELHSNAIQMALHMASGHQWLLSLEDVTQQRAILLNAAVELQRQFCKTGKYPEAWDGVPTDWYSDKPLIYRHTRQGCWLYSVGRNMQDDGGVFSRKDDLVVKLDGKAP